MSRVPFMPAIRNLLSGNDVERNLLTEVSDALGDRLNLGPRPQNCIRIPTGAPMFQPTQRDISARQR